MRSTVLAAALLLLGGLPTGGAHAQVVPDVPTVEVPITGPGPMHPGIRPGPEGTNLEDFDYVTEEYFVSGVAAGAPYKTRILIRKPRNPQKFSGMVVGEPTHRGGNALICQYARFGIGQRGHGCVTVAARRINLNNPATAGAGLKEFNLERYGFFGRDPHLYEFRHPARPRRPAHARRRPDLPGIPGDRDPRHGSRADDCGRAGDPDADAVGAALDQRLPPP